MSSTEYKISVICVYNDKYSFQNQLEKSLKMQSAKYEMIAIDNTSNRFESAAAALNYGANKATGNILVFSHQDIYLKDKDGLSNFASAIEQCNIGDIIGTQGVRDKSNVYYSNLTAGEEYDAELKRDYKNELIEVSCVDEGFFGMHMKTYKEHPFDEAVCNNWHLYCVESCLYSRKKGHKVFVYPIQLHHFSYGRISLNYMENLKQLCYMYGDCFKYIWTTCYKVRTNKLYINLLVCIWIINRKIRRKKLG